MKDKQFKHLMLDLETMGSMSYSSIISIGAVEFDMESGETGSEFFVNVDLQSCISKGLIINAETVMWWLNQSEEARKKLTDGDSISIEQALVKFTEFCNNEYQIWGNSARFDCGILQNAYNKCDMPIPWNFRKERCLRTLVSFKREIKEGTKNLGVLHDALDDCKHQINYCSKTWNSITNNIGHYYVVTGNEHGIDITSKKNFKSLDDAIVVFSEDKFDNFDAYLVSVDNNGSEKIIDKFINE